MKRFSVLVFTMMITFAVTVFIGGSKIIMAQTEDKPTETTTPPAVTIEVPTAFIKMVKIEPGNFIMGSYAKDDPDKSIKAEIGHESGETIHNVTITKGFMIGAYEVTQDQYSRIMGNNPSTFSECGGNCPVETVSFNDAIVFCNRLSAKEGLDSCYNVENDVATWNTECNGYRLPTEAQWEFAARAGTQTAFSTGECLTTDQGNFDGTERNGICPKGIFREKTMAVGSFKPNGWGLYDVHGNANEWVWDYFTESLSSEDQTDPVESEVKFGKRVIRGGSWYGYGVTCRSARRMGEEPDKALSYNGFRVARTIK